jgi:ParB family chromosome partitioning protein
MSKSSASAKIALAAPQTIPLDKLSVHEANVRQIKAGVSIEGLAADIATSPPPITPDASPNR